MTKIPTIPLKDFFKNPEKTNFQLSPTGNLIAFLAPHHNRLNIFIQPTNQPQATPTLVTNEQHRDLRQYFFKNDNCILYIKDNGGDENFHLYSVNLQTLEVKDLTPFENVQAQVIDDLENHPTDVIIQLNLQNPENFDAYRINVFTAQMTLIAQNPGGIESWITDHNGAIRTATRTDGVNNELLYRSSEDQPFKVINTTSFKEMLSPLFFTFDNQKIYALSNLNRDKTALIIYNPDTNIEEEILFEHPEVDLTTAFYSKKRQKLLGVYYITHKIQISFFDEQRQKLQQKLEELLGKENEIHVVSSNKNEDLFFVRTTSDRSIGNYYLYNALNHQLTNFGSVAPWLNPQHLSHTQPIQFTSRDGLTIHGYLTIPASAPDPHNLPLVLNPHGGPWHRDVWGFNPEVQFLANRGYAVLQINFRGSTGYGKKFWEASFKQWGQNMQNDLTDGVQWAINKGIANPSKIAIYGASYGGYATLAGITYTPNLYACAIDYVGVSNLFTFMKTIPPYWHAFLESMYEMVGHPEKDKEMLAKYSPALNAQLIKTPLFVVQGAKDPRVNIKESDQMVEALQKQGVQVKYMVKENEGHGFYNEENKFEFYTETELFLKQYLG